MPISDSDAEKLCRGRIVYAPFPSSSGTYRAGTHWAIMLDPTDKIQASGESRVVVISTNDELDPSYLVEVPRRVGIRGNIVCSWRPTVTEPQIEKIWHQPPLDEAELLPILEMILKHATDIKNRGN